MDKLKLTGLNLAKFSTIDVGTRPHREVQAHHENSLTYS
jgi:hypothetical protein